MLFGLAKELGAGDSGSSGHREELIGSQTAQQGTLPSCCQALCITDLAQETTPRHHSTERKINK